MRTIKQTTQDKRKLIKYPKYLILGLYASFRDDRGEFLIEFSLGGLIFGIPLLTPLYYFLIEWDIRNPTGLPFFVSMILALCTWWGLAAVLATTFIILPSAFGKLGSYVDKGEEEEYKIFKILKEKR